MDLLCVTFKVVLLPIMLVSGLFKLVTGKNLLGPYSIWPSLAHKRTNRFIGMVEIFAVMLITSFQCGTCPDSIIFGFAIGFLGSIVATMTSIMRSDVV